MDKEKALQLSSLLPAWNFPIPSKSLLTKNADFSSFSSIFFSPLEKSPQLWIYTVSIIWVLFSPASQSSPTNPIEDINYLNLNNLKSTYSNNSPIALFFFLPIALPGKNPSAGISKVKILKAQIPREHQKAGAGGTGILLENQI